MGNNSSKWDREAHYAKKSTKQLEWERDWWTERLKERPSAAGSAERTYL